MAPPNRGKDVLLKGPGAGTGSQLLTGAEQALLGPVTVP